MKITLTEIKQLGTKDSKFNYWNQTEEDRKRPDIDRSKVYLVKYYRTWLIGKFDMMSYGWNFYPNMVSSSIQIEWLEEIYELHGLI